MNVSIVAISQEFDLKTREQVNFAIFRLPNGKQFRARVEEVAVTEVLQLALNDHDAPPPIPPVGELPPLHNVVHDVGPEPEDETHVFGGEAPAPVPALAPEPKRVAPVASAKPIFAGRDEYGYPKLIYPNGIDSQQVTGLPDGAGDEDGIGQV